jgi:hypothetical protein
MYILSRIKSNAPEILVSFLIFSLSTGVVGGVVLYLDSIAPDVLSEMSRNVTVDMQIQFLSAFYEQNTTSVETYGNLVKEEQYVQNAECISFIDIYDSHITNQKYSRSAILGIEETFTTSFPDALDLPGSNSLLNSSNCYVQKSRLIDENLTIGDNYTVSVPTEEGYINRTFIIASSFESDLFMRRINFNSPKFSYLDVVVLRTTLEEDFSSLEFSNENSLRDRIWVKFDSNKLLREDPSAVVPLLRNIEKQFEQRMLPEASISDFVLIGVFYEYSEWALSMRIIAIAFSIPSIIMAMMLIYYNSRLGAEEQRRSVGALKTRGASGLQATLWILTMSLFTGVIGSVGAITTGIISALLAGTVRELLVFNISAIQNFAIAIHPQSIFLLFLFSFIAGLLVSIPIAVRAFLMTGVEAHNIIRNEAQTPEKGMSNPVVQIGALGLSGIMLVILIRGIGSFTDLSAGSAIIGITMIVLLAVFVLALTYLLARPSARLKAGVLLRVRKSSIAAICRVLARDASTFSRQQAVSVIFISLVFTAGVFSSVAASTGNEHMKALFMFDVGADIVIDVRPGTENVTLSLIDRIMSIDGVSHASGMMRTSTSVTYAESINGHLFHVNRTVRVYGIQPNEFAESAFLLPEFGYYGDPKNTIPLLEKSENNVMTNFEPFLGYSIDSLGNFHPTLSDNLGVTFQGPAGYHYLNCTIVNVLASTPDPNAQGVYQGMVSGRVSYMPGEDYEDQFLILNIASLQKYQNVTHIDRFYINLSPNANYTRVMQELAAIGPYSFEEISTPFTKIDNVLDSRAGEAIYGAYTLNILFSILYLTAGITLVETMRSRNLKNQFSIIRSLGGRLDSIIKAMLIDTAISMSIGAIAGSFIGIVLVALIIQMPLTYLGFSTQVTWQRIPLVVSIPIPVLIGILILAFAFSTLASYMVVHRRLQSNIARDIQHSE